MRFLAPLCNLENANENVAAKHSHSSSSDRIRPLLNSWVQDCSSNQITCYHQLRQIVAKIACKPNFAFVLAKSNGSNPKSLLKVSNRVVWLSDYGPEYGIVRWIGQLPDDAQGDLIAGIEFVSFQVFQPRFLFKHMLSTTKS